MDDFPQFVHGLAVDRVGKVQQKRFSRIWGHHFAQVFREVEGAGHETIGGGLFHVSDPNLWKREVFSLPS
jgi:hypothetical protein